MKKSEKMNYLVGGGAGLIMVIWFAVKIAPGFSRGIDGIIKVLSTITKEPFNFKFVAETPMTVFVASLIYITAVYLHYLENKDYRRGEEHGSAKWGSISAMRRKFTDFRKEHQNENIIFSQNLRLATDKFKSFQHRRNHHVLAVGGSGASKTRGLIMPNILQANNSYIALDPAGEILQQCGGFLKEQKNYNVRVFNVFETERSLRYNPFVYIQNDDDITKMVDMFLKATSDPKKTGGDPFWDDAGKLLMYALCYYLYYFAPPEEQNFPTVHWLITQMSVDEDKKEKSPVDLMFEELAEREPDHIAVKNYKSYIAGAGKTLQSIQITLFSKLGKFVQPGIIDLCTTTEDELGLFDMPEKKTALFLVVPTQDKSKNFFVSLLYQQLFDIIYAYGMRHGRLKYPVNFLMDEFANTKVPDSFDQILATIRKFGVNIMIILQSLPQLKVNYKDNWQEIVGNCDTLLYLGGNDTETHEYISKRLGKGTIRSDSYSTNKGRNGSTSKSTQLIARELMTPDEVAELDDNEMIVLIRGKHPIRDAKFRLQSHPNYKYTAFEDAEGQPYIQPTRQETVMEKAREYMNGVRIRTDLSLEQIQALPPLPLEDLGEYVEIGFFGGNEN